jgi:hypothetical protein
MADRIQIKEDITDLKPTFSEPQCMTERPPLDQSRTPLSDSETKDATRVLVNLSYTNLSFPKTQRVRNDPPVNGQNIAVIVFNPSKNAVPDADGCFGVLKVRGCFLDEKSAEDHAESLVRNVDSYNENLLVYVGRDAPICADFDKFCTSTKEVDVRQKLDTIAQDKIRSERTKEKEEMKQIQERHRELLTDTKSAPKFDDLEFYTTLRQKKGQCRMMIDETQKTLESTQKTLEKTMKEIADLDEKFPEYATQFEAQYKKALDAIGGNAAGNKLIEYMRD